MKTGFILFLTFITAIALPGQNADGDTTSCNCPKILDLVCVVSNGDTLMYSNRCFAECHGFTERDLVVCHPNDCICPMIYAPVCVKLADGMLRKFDNSCFALCSGFNESNLTLCDAEDNAPCNCLQIYQPVCAQRGDSIFTYNNPCLAECDGLSPKDFIICKGGDACICPEYYAPVCIVNTDGDTLKFSNPCFAVCEGYDSTHYFQCETLVEDDCVCPAIYDPVYAIVNSDTLVFSNACQAACAGYEQTNELRIITQINDPKLLDAFQLSPNPVRYELYLEFIARQERTFYWSILTLDGRQMHWQRGQAVGGINKINIPVSGLPTGMYLLRLETAEQIKTLKFAKD